ncbi:MAG: protoporphyrinogen oxidase [Kineosporiaceae bacterium]|nr:protoporphyrinogen oxidase [Kineosporiaceae bacterium]MBK8078625.1 protoporphyrinogen oxidase [Kineosporiaceae bacterium]
MQRIVVVGGGISGLATAYYLTRGEHPPQVTVLDAAPRVGGKITSAEVAGYRVDTGPEALLVRIPAVNALLADLGLDDARRAPRSTGAFIWARGALRRLPQSSIFGVPNKLGPLLRSGLVSPWGFLRAGADLVLPATAQGLADPSIAQLLRPRFGRQVFAHMIEPLLGGVHAGDAARLSARSAVPEVAAAVTGRRSVFLAMRGQEPRTGGGPALISLEGGLGTLVAALREALEEVPSTRIVTDGLATDLSALQTGGYVVRTASGETFPADEVVLAVPAPRAAALLGGIAPVAAAAAAEVPHVGVATVMLAYDPAAITRPLDGTGFLVPPADGHLLVGCTWVTAKWPHVSPRSAAEHADGPAVLIRCMVGRDGDQRWAAMDDEVLVRAVRAELAAAMGVVDPPRSSHVQRWPDAMPQYTVGHADRVATIDAALAQLPGVYLTGAGVRGVGLGSCIAAASRLATTVLARVGEGATTGGSAP